MSVVGNGAFASSLGLKQRIVQHKIVNYVIIRLKIIKNKVTDHDFANVLDLMPDAQILMVEKYNRPKRCSSVTNHTTSLHLPFLSDHWTELYLW